MIIREADEKDANAIAELYKIIYPNYSYPYKEFYEPKKIAELIKQHRFVVAEEKGKIVGSSALLIHGNIGELARLVVHPSYRGLGLAKKLLQSRVDIYKELRLSVLFAEVRGTSKASIANVWKRGLKPYGIIPYKFTVNNVRESAVIFSDKEPCNISLPSFSSYLSLFSGKKNCKGSNNYSFETIKELDIAYVPANNLVVQEELYKKGFFASSLLPLIDTKVIYVRMKKTSAKLSSLQLPDIIPKETRDLLISIERLAKEHIS